MCSRHSNNSKGVLAQSFQATGAGTVRLPVPLKNFEELGQKKAAYRKQTDAGSAVHGKPSAYSQNPPNQATYFDLAQTFIEQG